MPKTLQMIMDRTGWNQDRLAERLDTTQATVSRWMSGSDPRGAKRDAIRRLLVEVSTGDLDSMDVAELSDSSRLPSGRLIPVVGYVGAGAEVISYDDHEKGGGMDEVEAPPGASPHAVAVRVRGESMVPAYREGDHIIYDELATGAEIARYINKECVVRLTDGRTFIKTVVRGSDDDCWTLWSYNAPPMIDMILEWAAKVRWVEKA